MIPDPMQLAVIGSIPIGIAVVLVVTTWWQDRKRDRDLSDAIQRRDLP